LRYGPYLIGLNMTKNKTFDLQVPQGATSVKELVSKRENITPGSTEKVAPRSTIVLFIAGGGGALATQDQ
jgi:hypothetical protein